MSKYVIIGEKYAPLLTNSLDLLGYSTLILPDNPCVDPRLSCHADLSVFCDKNSIFLAKYLENSAFYQEINGLDMHCAFIDEEQSAKYPHDAQLNVCAFGDKFIYNSRSASRKIIEYLKAQGREGIECRQGYTKCSVCTVDNNSLITSDSGIAEICRKAGLEVLEISPGHIELGGFDYGFIGGASINLDDRMIAFTGALSSHPQREEIELFISSRGIDIFYLTDMPAFDIGSGIVIKT
ncbi:MAG: hypothetical protein IJB09_09275 [Oscillospiraceae bacterium]|nr:hypothetical protein [Oscillospiraceae bacterium]